MQDEPVKPPLYRVTEGNDAAKDEKGNRGNQEGVLDYALPLAAHTASLRKCVARFMKNFQNHADPDVPDPPRARLAVGAIVLLVGGLVLLGLVPFGMVTFGVVLVLIGAGLVI